MSKATTCSRSSLPPFLAIASATAAEDDPPVLDGLSLFAPTTFPNASAPYQTLLSPTPTSSPSFSARTTTVRRRTALGRAPRDAGPIRAPDATAKQGAIVVQEEVPTGEDKISAVPNLSTHIRREMAAVASGVHVPGLGLGASRSRRALSLRPGARSQPSHVRPSPRCRAASNETASTSASETATSTSSIETAVFALG